MTYWQKWRLRRQTRKAVYVIQTEQNSILIFSTDYELTMEEQDWCIRDLQEKFNTGCLLLTGKSGDRLRLEGVVHARQSR